jgi:hypothetical protein
MIIDALLKIIGISATYQWKRAKRKVAMRVPSDFELNPKPKQVSHCKKTARDIIHNCFCRGTVPRTTVNRRKSSS